MATLTNQETWVPYETTKDCSHGFCSIYCPQWCYIIFPPPPPLSFADDEATSDNTPFSPLVIALIGILGSAFLLVSYYTLISRFCGTFAALRRRLRSPAVPSEPDDTESNSHSRRHQPTWHITPSNGLEESLINKIMVYKFKRGEGMVDGTDCSVCLSEFREEETLRLLPKCSHAFHLQCIDTWLRSQSNCPLCRANIVSMDTPPPPDLATNNAPEIEVIIEDVDSAGIDEARMENGSDSGKDIVEVGDDEGGGSRSLERRSISMDSSSCHARVSIADVLRMSMEDEFLAAKDRGLFVGGGSLRMAGREVGKGSGRCRSLHCVMSPVPMKRSFSSGRFCFSRQGRGRCNSVLPL